MELGSKLGHYEIIDHLGAGGMGEVYRARDTKLKREVALKLLPEDLSTNTERLARLQREAQMLAALNHPNIAAIYGLEESDGVRFLAMELAEGQTLADWLEAGALEIDRALPIALRIAEALEAAHEKGIIHRDLKPGNVVVSEDGNVKVLDFGLAKAYETVGESSPELTKSPTIAAPTQLGVILGTAGYMSPEQARGKLVDLRTDVWAFGAVLYEMLTGTRLFDGETVTDVLGAIVHQEPDWSLLPAATPRRIQSLLERCLRKDIKRRRQAIGDVRVLIEEYLEDPEFTGAVSEDGKALTSWKQWIPWVAVAVLAVALAAALRPRATPPPDTQILRMETTVAVEGFLYANSPGSTVALSPDGELVAVVTGLSSASTQLNLRRLDSLDYTELAGDGAYHPFFSPDSEWVGYATNNQLFRVPTSGGTPQAITNVNRNRGASWAPDGTIIYAGVDLDGLWRISAAGGEPIQLTEVDPDGGDATHRWPQVLPDGKTVLFTSHSQVQGDFDRATIKVVDISSGTIKTVHRGGSQARYVASGHLVYANSRTLFAVPFDLEGLEIVGSPVPVVQNLATDPASGGAQFSASKTGILMYRTGLRLDPTHPAVWIDRQGGETSLLAEPRTYAEARVSPDGRQIAMMELTSGNWEV